MFRNSTLAAAALLLVGCPQAVVVNGSSNNISSVDTGTGIVTDDLGGIAVGPTASDIAILNGTAYVANSGAFPGSTSASVQVIDLNSETVVNTIPVADNENPFEIAVISATKVYVTQFSGNNVTVLNPTLAGAAAIVDTIALPTVSGSVPSPQGIVVHDGFAYVANTAFDPNTFGYGPGSVSIIDTATDTLVDADNNAGNGTDTPILTGCTNPQDLDVDELGQLNTICTGDFFSVFGELATIDLNTQNVTITEVGGSPGSISTAGNVALITDGGPTGCNLYAVRTDTGTVINDSADPLALLPTSGFCSGGSAAISDANPLITLGYIPAGAFAAEAALIEISVLALGPATTISVRNTFDLAPSANLPSAVALN